MRFNSWLHVEPYQGLTCRQRPRRRGDSYAGQRWCMAVVSSCREMLGQVLQRARPPPPVAIIGLSPATSATPILCYQRVMPGTHRRLPRTTWRKAGMTSSHHAPYALGHTRATMAGTVGSDAARRSGSQKPVPVRTGGCNPPPRSWNC